MTSLARCSYILKASSRIEKSSSGVHDVDDTRSAGRSERRKGSGSGEKDAADAIENAADVAGEAISVKGVDEGLRCFGRKPFTGGSRGGNLLEPNSYAIWLTSRDESSCQYKRSHRVPQKESKYGNGLEDGRAAHTSDPCNK